MSDMHPLDVLNVPLDCANLIEASAGTGKTYAIASLVLRLVAERGVRIDRILVVTYTKAATAELRGRIRMRLVQARDAFRGAPTDDAVCRALIARAEQQERENRKRREHRAAHEKPEGKAQERADEGGTLIRWARRLDAAVLAFDEAAIFTIHGYCQRALADHAFAAGESFETELLADDSGLLEEVVQDFWRLQLYNAAPVLVMQALDAGLTPARLAQQIRGCLGKPYLSYDEPPAPDIDTAQAAFERAFAVAAECWQRQGIEVGALLHQAELSRTSYRLASIPGWCAELDAWFAGEPKAALPEKFAQFTSAKLVKATKKGATPPRHAFFDCADGLAAAVEALATAFEGWLARLRWQLLRWCSEELPRRKQRLQKLAYDDLLTRLAAALASGDLGKRLSESLAGRYEAALIDEFQDTDPTQYEIFRAIYTGRSQPVFFVGDPKQAIYAFRGADVFAYLRASDDAPARHTLAVNWRSSPALIRAINALFGLRPDAFLLRRIHFHPVEASPAARPDFVAPDGRAALQLWRLPPGEGDKALGKGQANALVAAATAQRIAELLKAGQKGEARIGARALHGGDIAVLVRSHTQSAAIRDALLALGVPCVLQSRDSVFASREAELLMRLLAAVLDPRHEGRVRALLLTDACGLDLVQLWALGQDTKPWEAMLERFHRLRTIWFGRGGFPAMFRHWLSDFDVAARLLEWRDGERRLTNLLHLAELLAAAIAEDRLTPEASLAWLSDARAAAGVEDETRQLRLDSDAQRVQIVTIHRSKGLEYPVVFCPYLWNGRLWANDEVLVRAHEGNPENPDDSAFGRSRLEFAAGPDSELRRQAVREELAENLRLAYVALTRARYRCYLVWGAASESECSALAWLLHPHRLPDAAAVLAAGNGRKSWLADDLLRADLDALLAAAGDTCTIQPLPETGPGLRYRPALPPAERLQAAGFGRRLPTGRRTTSFTQLAEGRSHEGPDRDTLAAQPPAKPAAAQSPVETAAPRRDFRSFPRGAEAGTCLHAMLERLDFAADDEAIGLIAAEELKRAGIAADWLPAAVDGIRATLTTALDDSGLRLCELPADARRAELEFTFPLGRIRADGLGAVLRAHGVSMPGLAFKDIEGYLRGFIDLVCEAGGRVFIIDYKSNWLGPERDDYRAERLPAAMDAAGYRLQYLLYCVAIVRFLRRRRPGWRYADGFGGVRYLFLRGLDPALGSTHGVFAERPAEALIDALDAYLASGDVMSA